MKIRRLGALFAVAVLAVLFSVQSAVAGSATDLVKATIDEVIEVLKDPALKDEAKTEERRDKLRTVIRKRFSFDQMAMRSMGRHWRSLDDAEKKEFVSLFGELVENSYIEKVEGYTDEKIIYEEEVAVKNTSTVKTKLVTTKGTEIPIHYRMIDRGNRGWVVYDIVIEGVSLVRTYRTQFNSIMRSSDYADLATQLRAKL